MGLEEVGIVLEVEGDKAKIGMERSAACIKCGACRLTERNRQMILTVDNKINAKVGDRVSIELRAGALLKASVIVYIVPLIALLLGVMAGYWMATLLGTAQNGDIYGALFGIILAVISFAIIRYFEPHLSKSKGYLPIIKRVVKNDDGKEEGLYD